MDNQSIVAHKAKLLYQQTPYANSAIIVVAILVCWLFQDNLDAKVLIAWSLITFTLAILRLSLWYWHRSKPETANAKTWIKRHVWLTGLMGLAWGGASSFNFLIQDVQINTLFYVLVCGVTAAGVPVLAAWFWAYIAYTLPQVSLLVGVTAHQALTQPDTQALSSFLMVTLLIYYAMLISLALRAHRNIHNELVLKQKNDRLVSELNAEVVLREDLVKERTIELVQANERLRASQGHMLKLSGAVEASPNGILITDAAGIIEYVNPKCEQISGYMSAEVRGKSIDVYKSEDTPASLFVDIWQKAKSDGEWRGEIENQRKDGEKYWVKAYIAAVRDEAGNISHFVAIQEDITDSKKLAQQLSYQATHDELTGLINRAEFERRLRELVDDSKVNNSVHALCFMDLDQFKVINDTCGHIAGDELLRQLGHLMIGITRKSDTLARLGGDEFAVLMERCDLSQAERVANEIRELIEQFQFMWDSRIFTIGVSIGVANIHPHTLNMTEVLKQADTACYAAKNSGRNRVYLYQQDDQRLSEQQGEFKWVNEIKEALVEDRFELYVQSILPLMSAQDFETYEVLIRLRSKWGELSLPSAFLPSAERYNLSVKIDRWVLDKVFDWLECKVTSLKSLPQFAINLSGPSLGDSEMLTHIINRLQQASFPSAKIKFEITETAAISNLRHANSFINALSELGCEFSLDDFGSGLSSFGYLKNLPVASLKIDGMFVRDMLDDPLDFEMVKSINDIGHVMGMKTIAEFVESEQIWQKLREIGVDFAQGYFLGEPMPIDNILEITEDKNSGLAS